MYILAIMAVSDAGKGVGALVDEKTGEHGLRVRADVRLLYGCARTRGVV